MSKLAIAIQKQFLKEQKKKYGDQPVWSLIDPDTSLKDQLCYDKTEINNMYNNIVMNPHKYTHMNEWAYKTMMILNMMKEKGMCPENILLHIAVKQGFPNVVEKVLEFSSINVNSKGFNGRTPLHECLISLNPNMKILCILINAKANFSARDNDGNTPLNDVMLFWNRKGQEWLPLLIIDYLPNYDYTMVNNRGENLLEYAKKMDCEDCVIKKIISKMS